MEEQINIVLQRLQTMCDFYIHQILSTSYPEAIKAYYNHLSSYQHSILIIKAELHM